MFLIHRERERNIYGIIALISGYTLLFLQVIINYLVAVSNLGHTVYTRKQFSHIWNLVQEHDEDVARDIGGCRSEMHLSIWMWTVFVMSFSIWNCVSQGGINAFNEPWFQNVSYMMVYVASSLSVIKFSGLVYILGTRFFYLNSVAYAHAMGDTTIGHKTSSKVINKVSICLSFQVLKKLKLIDLRIELVLVFGV